MSSLSEEFIRIKANFDKETKTINRFIIEDNTYGISGSLYVKKEDAGKANTLLIKVKSKVKKKKEEEED